MKVEHSALELFFVLLSALTFQSCNALILLVPGTGVEPVRGQAPRDLNIGGACSANIETPGGVRLDILNRHTYILHINDRRVPRGRGDERR